MIYLLVFVLKYYLKDLKEVSSDLGAKANYYANVAEYEELTIPYTHINYLLRKQNPEETKTLSINILFS